MHEGHRDISRDPREDEDWFQRLPDEAQEEMRQTWRAKRERFHNLQREEERYPWRTMPEGVAVIVAPMVMGYGLSPVHLTLGALVGGGVGYVWGRYDMHRFASLAVGMPAGFLLNAGFLLAGGSGSAILPLFFGSLITGCLCIYFGMRRETRGYGMD